MKTKFSTCARYCLAASLILFAPLAQGSVGPEQPAFPPTAVQSGTRTTLNLTVTLPANTISPVFSLKYGVDFSIGSVACNATCIVPVTFNPRSTGLRQDAVLAIDATHSVVATQFVNGVGLGPELAVEPGIIMTYAGNNLPFFAGDGGPAFHASLALPGHIALDPLGDLYVADSLNEVVRKISAAGTITTVAGNAALGAGYTGDGGPATSARLNTPVAVALDPAGNLYIADNENNRIRRVDGVTGIITTVAGGGVVTSGVGDGHPAIHAVLNGPSDVVVDAAGNLYIADSYNGLVREVDASGLIWTLAGGGACCTGGDGLGDGGPALNARLENPSALALGANGGLYIADTGNNRIRFVSAGTITLVAGTGAAGHSGDGGLATAARLNAPYGMAVDAAGDLYVADYGNNVIRKIQGGTGIITTVAGTGGAGYSGNGGTPTTARLTNPSAVVLDGTGTMYVSDTGNSVIRVVTFGLVPWAFGSAQVGQVSALQTQQLLNVGNQPLSITSLSIPQPATFVQQASGLTDCLSSNTLRAGAGCGIGLAFAPWMTGGFSGTLSFQSNTLHPSIHLQSAGVSGTGVGTVASQPRLNGETLAFPAQAIGVSSGVQNVTITNTDTNNTMQITGLTLSGSSDFSITANQCRATLAPGATCTIGVTFDASAGGTRSATLQVTDMLQGTLQTQTVFITGTGTVSPPTVSPASITFTNTAWGVASVEQTVTLLNTSATTLSIQSLALSGPADFAVSSTSCGGTLRPLANCTVGVTFTPSVAGQRSATLIITDSASNSPQSVSLTGTGATALEFVPVQPCRVVDTRYPAGPLGGPALAGGTSRDFNIPNGSCNIPSSAAAYALNVTVVPHGFLGYVSVWPTGLPQPYVSTLNAIDGRIKANAAIVPAGAAGAISVYATDRTEVILDISGYFVPKGSSSAGLAFFPLTPCRVLDTRNSAGPLGGPSLQGHTSRLFPVTGSGCQVPSSARAYSMNVTTVPHQAPLSYLTTWPSGGAQPFVSTLNAPTGTLTANAAIIPAGNNGSISVYATDNTDVLMDVNGYFAPQSTGGLYLFTVAPCRVLDTRQTSGQVTSTTDIDFTSGGCRIPALAQAVVANATAVPNGFLGYISLWPAGQTQPFVSTLNAIDGVITSNMAIVPVTAGHVSAYVRNPTHLVMDVSAYMQ